MARQAKKVDALLAKKRGQMLPPAMAEKPPSKRKRTAPKPPSVPVEAIADGVDYDSTRYVPLTVREFAVVLLSLNTHELMLKRSEGHAWSDHLAVLPEIRKKIEAATLP